MPHRFAAITLPPPAATRRMEVTINSLARIMITSAASAHPNATKHTKAEIVKILSATGSANFPKSVTKPCFLAILPSSMSVREARENTRIAQISL